MQNKAILKQVEGRAALLLNYKVEEDRALGLDVDMVMPEAACPGSTCVSGPVPSDMVVVGGYRQFCDYPAFQPCNRQ